MKTCLQHARVVLANNVLEDSSVLIEDGYISAVGGAAPSNAVTIDLGGQFLLPGLIDVHGDALEKFIEPRPNVLFPLDFALAQADRVAMAAGITTPFHAIAFSEGELGVRNTRLAAEIVRAIGARRGLCDTRVHVRYEITDRAAQPLIRELVEEGAAHMLSFMDHTPGQGQFKSLEAYTLYITKTYNLSHQEAENMASRKMDERKAASERISQLAAAARAKDVPIASHDDDSPERVELMAGLGATISEFPINLETAAAARKHHMATIVGAPNVLRGKSQTSSLRAIDAIKQGQADCLCADYVPAALLAAVFRVVHEGVLELHHAARLATLNAARAAGMADRGEIAPGLRADLIAVELAGGFPHVTSTWVNGRRVFASESLPAPVTV
ncbi:MAG: phosphonate metabolism protein PhnM [Planctomycetes bacterium]|nr:phosphonate metabolism protein PhnM [Planctomycetota bacterium]